MRQNCTVTRMTGYTREVVRNQLLLDALGGPIDLNAVDRCVQHGNPSASPVEVQNETLDARHYGDPEKWMFAAWLSPTGKGELLARSLEEKDIDGYRSKAT
jgi:hypothetical protein